MREGWIESRKGKRGTTYRARFWVPNAQGVPEPQSKSFPEWDYRDRKNPREEAEKAAKLFLAQTLIDLDSGAFVSPSELTLRAFVDRWLETKADTVRPATIVHYEGKLKHVSPELFALPLQKIKPAHIQTLYARLRAGGLGTASVVMLHTVLNQVFRQAVRWELLARSPMAAVIAPRDEPRPTPYWQPGTIGRFLAGMTGDAADRALWRLLALTGMRIGEALTLEWRDIDVAAGTITVRRTLTRDRKDQRIPGTTTKSKNGLRTIPLPAPCAEDLVAQAERVREWRRSAATWSIAHGDLVFPRDDGRMLLDVDARRRFRLACVAAGVPPINPHGLRHSFISALYHDGVNPLVIAALVGDSVGAILKTYAHVLDGAREDAIARMHALVMLPDGTPKRDNTGARNRARLPSRPQIDATEREALRKSGTNERATS